MAYPLLQIDASSDHPFAGNPAAVCLLGAAQAASWMQAVAAEMNLSETAFLVKRGDNEFDLRWFTPTVEVRLCGHATLASAHALWQEEWVTAGTPIRFHTLSGVLTATRRPDGNIELDFPSQPPHSVALPPGLEKALGARIHEVGQSSDDLLVLLTDEDTVRSLEPDFAALGKLPYRGIIVTARATNPTYDFVSRFFGPTVGINEDPVTGSAHCRLAPYWAEKLGNTELTGYQASRRGGMVHITVAGDRVLLAGQAVTVLQGRLTLD